MRVSLRYRGEGAAFDAETEGGQRLVLDGSPNLGGQGLGARPMEMVLFGLAGCAGMDVLHIIRKGRRELSHAFIEVDAQRADAVPAIFERVHLSFDLSGEGLSQEVAERAVNLSIERYCSVAQMLQPHVEITTTVRVTSPT